MHYELRPATAEDQPFLAELFRELHAPEFAPLQLPEAALRPLLDMQFRGQGMSYSAQFPLAENTIFTVDGSPVGRMLVERGRAGWRLVDIGLLPAFQGNAIGSSALKTLLKEAVSAGVPVQLSVRFGNPAIRLYERLGFRQTGGDGVNIFMEASASSSGLVAAEENTLTTGDWSEDPEGTLPGATSNYFGRLTGETLFAGAEGIPLRVTEVRLLPAPKSGMPVDVNDSFVVTLKGPPQPVLASVVTDFRRNDGQVFQAFIVPTGVENGLMRYEITFNRMRPRPIPPQV